MPYETVCKKLKVEFEEGKGLKTDDGIDLEYLQKRFDRYFDSVENFDSESYEFQKSLRISRIYSIKMENLIEQCLTIYLSIIL